VSLTEVKVDNHVVHLLDLPQVGRHECKFVAFATAELHLALSLWLAASQLQLDVSLVLLETLNLLQLRTKLFGPVKKMFLNYDYLFSFYSLQQVNAVHV
jgi:hypothetical protein